MISGIMRTIRGIKKANIPNPIPRRDPGFQFNVPESKDSLIFEQSPTFVLKPLAQQEKR
jgi:hypothetical protein